MSFKGVNPSLLDKIRGWKLSEYVSREFFLRLADDLTAKSPSEIPVHDRGMLWTIQVHDGEHPQNYYVFTVRLHRNDMDFWVSDCSCVGIDRSGEIFWSSVDTQ